MERMLRGISGAFRSGRRLDVPAPKAGAKRYFFLLFNFFWKFVTLNLLFLLTSLPVVTLPAAASAMNRVLIKLVRESNVLLWEEFRDEFKASFKKGLYMGVFFALWGFAAYYLLSLGLTNWDNPFGMFFTSMGVILMAGTLLWASYAFVLSACLELPAKELLRNARILMFLGGRNTAAVFGVLLAALAVQVLFFPVALILPIAGGIAITQFTVCWFVNGPMQKHIVGPYEQRAEGSN